MYHAVVLGKKAQSLLKTDARILRREIKDII
jgi:hypothetical protein